MNYYDARQRQEDGRWDYTSMNRRSGIHPVGYCRSTAVCSCATPETGYRGDPEHEECGGTGQVPNPDHCGGHDTAEEARECFARYLLDGWREEGYGNWHGCEWKELGELCDAPTKKGLATRPPLGHGFALCDHHRTFDHLKHLAPSGAGQIVASF